MLNVIIATDVFRNFPQSLDTSTSTECHKNHDIFNTILQNYNFLVIVSAE